MMIIVNLILEGDLEAYTVFKKKAFVVERSDPIKQAVKIPFGLENNVRIICGGVLFTNPSPTVKPRENREPHECFDSSLSHS